MELDLAATSRREWPACSRCVGTEALEQLCDDPRLQRYLHSSDQLSAHGGPGCQAATDADVEMAAQQRFSRINRDVQRRVKRVQDDETAFRLVS